MRVVPISSAAALLLFLGCAGQELVRADDMTATQHRLAAQQENEAAAKAAGSGPAVPAAAPAVEPVGYAWNAERQQDAERRREHAHQHEAAAAFLEQFEDRECRHVAPGSRAACPLLGPLVRIEDVPGGIRATFADERHVPTAIAEMRCHYAYARARHFDEAIGCPLYVQAIVIRQGLDPRAIEIVARDEKTARLIRERGRQQAIFSRHATR